MGKMSTLEKLAYFATQAHRRVLSSDEACPNCANADYVRLERKAIVTELRECTSCKLMYRFPTDPRGHGDKFYQEHYQQGFTTSLPSEEDLDKLLGSGFAGHEKSYAPHIALLKKLGARAGSSVFDYGCSWGYGSWQFKQAGFNVKSFELSKPRAAFARARLDIDIYDDLATLAANADSISAEFFFSNHVVEHVPRPAEVAEIAQRVLRPGGYFVAITPNGSLGYRNRAPKGWSASWGNVHPNLISDSFWRHTFADRPHFVGSFPSTESDLIKWFQEGGMTAAAQNDAELLCVAKL